jgi:DNA-directed RNA polymerase specialized sigma24 family protein
MDLLARRYRRLLFAYPDSYRRQRGDELLGTLLDTARPGQRRPTVADAADLMLGGLRQRLGGSVAADLEAGLALAAPFALALAAGLCGFLWLTVERLPVGVPSPGSFLTLGPVAYAVWLAAAVLRAVLPAAHARVPVAAAMAVTALLIPAAAIGGYQRPPLWVILALLGFGAIALAGGGEPLTGAARLAVPVGVLVAAALAKALLNWQQPPADEWWGTFYYQPSLWLAGAVAAVAVLGVAGAGAVAAVRGRPARPDLWAALLLALPGGWLGPMNTQRALQFQPGLAFGRLAEVVLASCLVLAAMTWLAAVRQDARVGLLERAGTLAVGCAAGVSVFLGLASHLLFTPARDWPAGDWEVYLGWVLVAAVWPYLGASARRVSAGAALLLTFTVTMLPIPVAPPPPGVRGSLAVLGVVAIIAPGRYRGRLAVPVTTLLMAAAAALIAVYDNGWELTGWVAYQQTAALVMTVVIAPLTVALVAGVRAVVEGTRTATGGLLVLTGAGWIGLLALPSFDRWGPTLLLLPAGLAAVLVVQRLRRRPARVARLRAYADAHGTELLSLAYLLTGDRSGAEHLVGRALAAAYRSGHVDDREVRQRLVRMASRASVPAESTVDDPLWTAVRRLPPPQRTALVLHLHAGLSPAEIADLTRRPEAAVRRLTADALAELEGALGRRDATRATPAK